MLQRLAMHVQAEGQTPGLARMPPMTTYMPKGRYVLRSYVFEIMTELIECSYFSCTVAP